MSTRRDPHDTRSPARSEPTLGDLDRVDDPRVPPADGLPRVTVEPRRPRDGRAPAARSHRKRRGWLIPALLALLVAFGGVLWFNQSQLRGMLPRTDLNTVLTQAQLALKDGHLDGQDGTSARELFQQVAAQEPDNDRARGGLREVGQAELSRADAALQSGQLAEAAQRAAVARELLGGGSDVDRLDALISHAHASQVHTVDLVDQAQQALAAGKLDGPQGAGALYQRVLQADPGNAVAAHGLDQVGNALAVQAQIALASGDLVNASTSIEQLAALQPNNGSLPALRALQVQLRQKQDGALTSALEQAREALRAGRVAGAGDDTALAYYKAALTLAPDSSEAKAGLGDVAQALTVQANAAIDADDREQAGELLDEAAQLAPKSADLAAARARLRSKAGISSVTTATASGDIATAVLSSQQNAAVAQLVRRAQLATQNGNILMPPGDSAYDLYRSALAIDGNDAAAREGLQGLSDQAQQQFLQALAAGKLAQASDMLANLAELSPGDPAQSALGGQLANAWLDRAEQQLGSGDRIGAGQSLARARKLTPNQPRLMDLSARLQGGQ